MLLDIASDLHVDAWAANIDWLTNKGSNIIIIAGDISDNLNDDVSELNKLAEIYDHVLFITATRKPRKKLVLSKAPVSVFFRPADESELEKIILISDISIIYYPFVC